MHADSSLKFRTQFADSLRMAELKGQAYCVVAKNKEKVLETKVHFVANRSDGIKGVVEGLNMMNIINVEYKGNKLVVF